MHVVEHQYWGGTHGQSQKERDGEEDGSAQQKRDGVRYLGRVKTDKETVI